MVVIIGNNDKFIIQKKIQKLLYNLLCFPQKTDFSLKSYHPTIPSVITKGIAGKINHYCLLGNIEWNKMNKNVGKNNIKCFFQLLKNPKIKKRLIGGTSIPPIYKEYEYHLLVS